MQVLKKKILKFFARSSFYVSSTKKHGLKFFNPKPIFSTGCTENGEKEFYIFYSSIACHIDRSTCHALFRMILNQVGTVFVACQFVTDNMTYLSCYFVILFILHIRRYKTLCTLIDTTYQLTIVMLYCCISIT